MKTVPLRRNLTGSVFANRYRTDTEWVQQRKQNRYRTGTEWILNRNGTKMERLLNGNGSKKVEKRVLWNANYKRMLFFRTHASKLPYQIAYQGFGNNATLKTCSSNFCPAQ